MSARCVIAIALAALTLGPSVAQAQKADAVHRRGICGEVVKLDLLLYDMPRGHAATATCSYTDARLLVKPRTELTPDRMKRFVFLAFITAGALANEDYMMPSEVYAGFGAQCQVLPIGAAATLQRAVKFDGDSGFVRGMMTASAAPRVPCPK